MPEHQCDVLVVGSGAAGLSSALAAAKAGRAVTIMTREGIDDSSTDLAQGGLAAVWGSNDSFSLHLEDTLTAGAGLCHRDNVDDLVRHAPQTLRPSLTSAPTLTPTPTANPISTLRVATTPDGSSTPRVTGPATKSTNASARAYRRPE